MAVFLRLAFGDFFGEVAHLVEFGGHGLWGGQLRVLVAFLGHELTTPFSGTQAGVQALGAEVGIVLTLAIDDVSEVIEQMGQVDFGSLAPASRKGIETDEATVEFVHAFSNGDAVPAQFAFGLALAAGAELFDSAGHEEPSGAAFERRGRFDKERFKRIGQFHSDTSGLGLLGLGSPRGIGSQGGIV